MNPLFCKREHSPWDLFDVIEHADHDDLNRIIDAVIRRHQCLYPDHDLAFLSLPREPESRKQQLEWILDQIKAGQLL